MADKYANYGKSWDFPIHSDVYGKIKLTDYVSSIENSIRIILSVSPGELVTDPTFGSRVNEVIFQDPVTAVNLAEYYIREALTKWEPRIKIDEVKCTLDSDDQHLVNVMITYIIKATGEKNKLPYDITLEQKGG